MEGWSWTETGEKSLQLSQEESDESDDDEGQEESKEEEIYRTEVIVERHGDFVHPITVELIFEDGEKIRHDWDGQDPWIRYVENRRAKLVSAEIDPDQLLTLEVDRINNSRRLEPNKTPATKILVHLVFWLQNVFELSSIVG